MQGVHGTIHPIRSFRKIETGLGAELPPVERTVRCCGVCGSREVRTDEVDRRDRRGWVLLAECRHCDHRWTRRLPDDAPPLRSAVSARPAPERGAEIVTAA